MLECMMPLAICGLEDNWRTTQQDAIIAAGLAPANDLESVFFNDQPGTYTAIVKGVNNVHRCWVDRTLRSRPADVPARLANISTRGNVLTERQCDDRRLHRARRACPRR